MTQGHIIEGRNVHVFKYDGATPYEIVCGTDVIFEITQELIGATTPESGGYTEIRPRFKSWTVTVSGVTTSTNDSDYSVFHFVDEDIFDQVQDIEIVYTDNNGSERTIRGNCYIERIPITGATDNASTYEIVMRGSGHYTVTDLVDPAAVAENVDSDTFTVSGGVIQDASLIGVNIIEVCREGTELTSMNFSYTYDSGTGTITPDAATTIDGQKIFVIWTY